MLLRVYRLNVRLGGSAYADTPRFCFLRHRSPQVNAEQAAFEHVGLRPCARIGEDLHKRFATIGVEAGQPFDPNVLIAEQRQALDAEIADEKAEFSDFKKTKVDTHKISSGDLFGTRQYVKNNYLCLYAGTNMGVFGNAADEAAYLGYFVDNQGRPVDALRHDYTLHFN